MNHEIEYIAPGFRLGSMPGHFKADYQDSEAIKFSAIFSPSIRGFESTMAQQPASCWVPRSEAEILTFGSGWCGITTSNTSPIQAT